jgi:monoamine oxidase
MIHHLKNLSNRGASMRHPWNRRRFLAATLLASAYAPSRRPSAALARRNPRVLVIGAGVSGLGAARELGRQGFEVTVVEGRDRIGGRIWTDRSLGAPVDMGAGWIEEIDGNPVTELAKEYGAQHALSDDESWALHDVNGSIVSDSSADEIDEATEEIGEELEELAEELSEDISVEEGIRRIVAGEEMSAFDERALEWIISVVIEGSAAAPASRLSLREGVDVRLSHEVHRIAHDRNGVRVETSQGSFEADYAVVTLPLGVLRAGTVEFSPALPESKRQALQSLDMGLANKVVLSFPRAFWPQSTHYLGYISETRGEFSSFVNLFPFLRRPILVSYLSGDYALSIEPLSDEETAGRAMRVLRTMYGRSIPEPDAVRITRWGQDRFTMGAYSYVVVGGVARAYDVLAEPISNRLFFAGEGTNRLYPATVHGAFLSGVREANRIAKL